MYRCLLLCYNRGIYFNEYMQVAKHQLFLDGGSCGIETFPLICSANRWTGFCIIGSSAMKDSRCSSSTYNESLFLYVVKHNLLFLSFFLSGFSFTNIHDSQDSRWKGRLLLSPFYHFHPLHRHLDISWVIAAETPPLRIAGSRNWTWKLWHTPFRTHSFHTCTGSCSC